MFFKGFSLFCIVLFFSTQSVFSAVFPAEEGKSGMVSTDHPLASKAGVDILKSGGNAVDAACAAMFVLGVANPTGSGIGGGGFMMLKLKEQKEPLVLDFRERAPLGSSRLMFLVKTNQNSRQGGLAVGVPGEVLGCETAVKKYGKLPWGKVLQPSILLAYRGFPVGKHLASQLQQQEKKLRKWKSLYSIFFPNGKALVEGELLRRPRLAKTLRDIARKGSKVFYQGWIAEDIVQTARKTGGILTLQDLKEYTVTWRKPLQTSFHGYDIFTMPPPSSGGIAIIQILNILKTFPLKKWGQNSSLYLFHLIEAFQHAFSDRARYLGDTDFSTVPVSWLVSEKYADVLRKRIGTQKGALSNYGTGKPKAANRDGGTSHLNVIDSVGNTVALTTTINMSFGSLLVGSKSGILLNNEMDDFTTHPGKPNAYGLLQSKNNEIAPKKRPLSSMSPTLVLKKGKPLLALGASGGPTIITGTLQVLLNVLVFDLELNDAVSRSRIHQQWLPSLLFLEKDLSMDVIDSLKKRGHKTRFWPHPFTAVQAILQKGSLVYGASDPRKMGKPKGY